MILLVILLILSINTVICRNPENLNDLVPLRMLARGQTAAIGELVGGPEHVHRLRELGLHSGAQIEMLRPGSPCIVRIDGQRLCFRETELVGILVRPGAGVVG